MAKAKVTKGARTTATKAGKSGSSKPAAKPAAKKADEAKASKPVAEQIDPDNTDDRVPDDVLVSTQQKAADQLAEDARNEGRASSASKAQKAADQLADDARSEGRGGSATALREKVAEDEGERPTYFTATTGGLMILQPKPLFDGDGKRYGSTPEFYLEFNDEGMSRPFYPGRHARDAEQVEAIERFIELDGRTAEKVRLTKRGDLEAMPPCARWDVLAPANCVIWLQGDFTENHEENQRKIKDAARYEVQSQNRTAVLAALDALLASEVAHGVMNDELEVVF